MCAWIYLRHYQNLRIIASLFTEFKTVGPYEMNWETGQYKCPLAFYITLSLLASLQALNLFWLFFIVRIAYRLVVYKEANDDRSEADESEIEEREREKQSMPLLNGGDGVSGDAKGATETSANANFNGTKASSKTKSAR